MNNQKQTFNDSSILTGIDILTTDDQTLIELARSIVIKLETKKVKIINLNRITPDHRFIQVNFLE
jgi:hypothetical protein